MDNFNTYAGKITNHLKDSIKYFLCLNYIYLGGHAFYFLACYLINNFSTTSLLLGYILSIIKPLNTNQLKIFFTNNISNTNNLVEHYKNVLDNNWNKFTNTDNTIEESKTVSGLNKEDINEENSNEESEAVSGLNEEDISEESKVLSRLNEGDSNEENDYISNLSKDDLLIIQN